jgi:hypothetical protein
MMRTFNQNNAIRMINTAATYAAAAVYGSWLSMVGYDRCTVIGVVGAMSADVVMAIYEATDASGSDAQALTGLTGTFTNNEDEGLPGLIEVRAADLSDGFTHITALVTPAASASFGSLGIFSGAYAMPVTNTEDTHVAFNVGEEAS